MTAPGPGQPGAAAPGPAAERISAAYTELFGSVPASIETRLALAEQTGRLEAVEAIEAPRRVLILDNPLGRKTGQLVHFAQLIAVGKAEPVRLHARAARKAGASLGELAGAAELAPITAGMPAYGLGVEILAEAAAAEAAGETPGEAATRARTASALAEGEPASPASNGIQHCSDSSQEPLHVMDV
jgi:4-carboxymuconolactone decarboxylase